MNKTILITGATSGIGKATLNYFITNGWYGIGTYHTDEETAQLMQKNHKDSCTFFPLDLKDDASIIAFSKKLHTAFPTIHVMINNAGHVYDKLLDNTSFQEIDNQIDTNLTGTIKLTKEVIDIITEQIINVGSIYSKEAHREYATYCASKWGIRGFSKALAKEVSRLKVLCAHPGPTKTKMNDFWQGGVEPEAVAEVLYNVVTGKLSYTSGDDVDIYDLV